MLISIEQAEADLYLTPNNRDFAYLIRGQLKEQEASQHSEHALDVFYEYQNKPSASNLDKLNQALTAWQKDLPAEYQRCEPVIHKLFQAIRRIDPGYQNTSKLAGVHLELKNCPERHLIDHHTSKPTESRSPTQDKTALINDASKRLEKRKKNLEGINNKIATEKKILAELAIKHQKECSAGAINIPDKSWQVLQRAGLLDAEPKPTNNKELVALLGKSFSEDIANHLVKTVPFLADPDSPVTLSTLSAIKFALSIRARASVVDLARRNNATSISPFRQANYNKERAFLGSGGLCVVLSDRWFISKKENTDYFKDIGYDWKNMTAYPSAEQEHIGDAALDYYGRAGTEVIHTDADASWRGSKAEPDSNSPPFLSPPNRG